MKDSTKRILSYYRSCFHADCSELNLWNLTKLKKEDKFFLENRDEIGQAYLPRQSISEKFGSSIQERLPIYQREKTLIYASLFIVGKFSSGNETQTICSPLLYTDANIDFNGEDYFAEIDHSNFVVNEPLLKLLDPENEFLDNFQNPEEYFNISYWVDLLKKCPVEIESLELLNYPNIAQEKEAKNNIKSTTLTALPMSVLAFVDRSRSSRGILHEMDSIAEGGEISTPLSNLLEQKTISSNFNKVDYDYLPCSLSASQKNILHNAAKSSLSSVSGPPGTGKSYTIAAIAAEHASRGESVLIVANTETAIDVIASKISSTFDLGDLYIRAGRQEFLKQLKTRLADMLSGYHTKRIKYKVGLEKYRIDEVNYQIKQAEKQFLKFCKSEFRKGKISEYLDDKDYKTAKAVYRFFTKQSQSATNKERLLLSLINELEEEKFNLSSSYLQTRKKQNISDLLYTDKPTLRKFNSAIRARTSKKQFDLFDELNFKNLFKAFPIWLVSLNTLHKVLPLYKELFDVVLIDEATQCNITSCIPALQRAKRAVVIGDIKQLRHYSFVSKSKEANFKKKFNLTEDDKGVMSYRDNSILDITLENIDNHNCINLLDEHFRSKSEIISFSNQKFYNNLLKVMRHRPCSDKGNIHIINCDGKRSKAGTNAREADEIIKSIKRIIKNSNKDIDEHLSIGVISPFRNQAEYLQKKIEKEIEISKISKHNILVSTPYGFQGEERDVIMLSFAVDDETKNATAYLNKEDVFNVTITRAKHEQYIFISCDHKSLPTNSLLKEYITSIDSFKASHKLNDTICEFQNQICALLEENNIKCWNGYSVVGAEIDILCFNGTNYVGIDLIGSPSDTANYLELDSYKILKRSGINILPIAYSAWQDNQENCIADILSSLKI